MPMREANKTEKDVKDKLGRAVKEIRRKECNILRDAYKYAESRHSLQLTFHANRLRSWMKDVPACKRWPDQWAYEP